MEQLEYLLHILQDQFESKLFWIKEQVFILIFNYLNHNSSIVFIIEKSKIFLGLLHYLEIQTKLHLSSVESLTHTEVSSHEIFCRAFVRRELFYLSKINSESSLKKLMFQINNDHHESNLIDDLNVDES